MAQTLRQKQQRPTQAGGKGAGGYSAQRAASGKEKRAWGKEPPTVAQDACIGDGLRLARFGVADVRLQAGATVLLARPDWEEIVAREALEFYGEK